MSDIMVLRGLSSCYQTPLEKKQKYMILYVVSVSRFVVVFLPFLRLSSLLNRIRKRQKYMVLCVVSAPRFIVVTFLLFWHLLI